MWRRFGVKALGSKGFPSHIRKMCTCSGVFEHDAHVISMLGLMSGEHAKACGPSIPNRRYGPSFIDVSGGFSVRQSSGTYMSYLTGFQGGWDADL